MQEKEKNRVFGQISKSYGQTIEKDFLSQKDFEYFFVKNVPYKVKEMVRIFPYYGGYSQLPIYKKIVAIDLVSGKEKIIEGEDFNKIVPTIDKEEIIISIISTFSKDCLSKLSIIILIFENFLKI